VLLPLCRSSSIVEAPVSRVGRLLPRGSAAFLKHILIARGEVIAKVANYLGNLTLVQANSCHDHMYRSVEAILGTWKRREPLAWWVPAARLKLFAGLTGLLNPSFKSGTKLFQPYFMNCFNCASPRCVGPPICGSPSFLSRVPFSQHSA
jgi:hypothetical protein